MLTSGELLSLLLSSSRMTLDQVNVAIQQAVKNQVAQAVADAAGQTASATTSHLTCKSPKINMPDTFIGNRADLQKFLAQTELYTAFNPNTFDIDIKKIMFIASYMQEAAFAWFEYHIRKWFDKEIPEAMKKTMTVEYCTNLQSFIAKLVKLYRDDNKERAAKHKLN